MDTVVGIQVCGMSQPGRARLGGHELQGEEEEDMEEEARGVCGGVRDSVGRCMGG